MKRVMSRALSSSSAVGNAEVRLRARGTDAAFKIKAGLRKKELSNLTPRTRSATPAAQGRRGAPAIRSISSKNPVFGWHVLRYHKKRATTHRRHSSARPKVDRGQRVGGAMGGTTAGIRSHVDEQHHSFSNPRRSSSSCRPHWARRVMTRCAGEFAEAVAEARNRSFVYPPDRFTRAGHSGSDTRRTAAKRVAAGGAGEGHAEQLVRAREAGTFRQRPRRLDTPRQWIHSPERAFCYGDNQSGSL